MVVGPIAATLAGRRIVGPLGRTFCSGTRKYSLSTGVAKAAAEGAK